MRTLEIYNRLKHFADAVLGIPEEKLLRDMPFNIITKIHNNQVLHKDDFQYFKETYNVNVAYLISGNPPLIRTDFAQISRGLLSKSQIEELIFISKERLN